MEVEFDERVAQCLEHDGHIIVRTEPAGGTINNRNVYGVSAAGAIDWQIEDQPTIYGDSPYTQIALKGGSLHAYNWDGSNVLLDPANGKLLEIVQGK